eukprot:COSAG02_NODE_4038_length_5874_cov_2.627661_2_plen_617_part_00
MGFLSKMMGGGSPARPPQTVVVQQGSQGVVVQQGQHVVVAQQAPKVVVQQGSQGVVVQQGQHVVVAQQAPKVVVAQQAPNREELHWNLHRRFPSATHTEIQLALLESGGHAGKAAGILKDRGHHADRAPGQLTDDMYTGTPQPTMLELRKKAELHGVNPYDIEDARDADNPKETLQQLIHAADVAVENLKKRFPHANDEHIRDALRRHGHADKAAQELTEKQKLLDEAREQEGARALAAERAKAAKTRERLCERIEAEKELAEKRELERIKSEAAAAQAAKAAAQAAEAERAKQAWPPELEALRAVPAISEWMANPEVGLTCFDDCCWIDEQMLDDMNDLLGGLPQIKEREMKGRLQDLWSKIQVFNRWDKNPKDGTINYMEVDQEVHATFSEKMRRMLLGKHSNLQDKFDALDTNKDGNISFGEFYAACADRKFFGLMKNDALQQVEQAPAGRIPVVVSCPEKGRHDDGTSAMVMDKCRELQGKGKLKLAFDQSGSSNTYPGDEVRFSSARHLWNIGAEGERQMAKKMILETSWWTSYEARVKTTIMTLAQDGNGPITALCIKGGMITTIEEEEMDGIIRKAKDDTKAQLGDENFVVEVTKKDMSYDQFLDEYDR